MTPDNTPFFVVGASRSGTTMLRLLLNAHSRLTVPRELKYFNGVPLKTGDTNWHPEHLPRRTYDAFVTEFFSRRADLFDGIDLPGLIARVLSVDTPDFRFPYVTAMEAIAARDGKPRWAEKTPANLYYVDVLVDMFPTARFIYIVRDPRAVVNSMNAIRYYSGDTTVNARNWLEAATRGYDLFVASIPAEQRMVVRYETLAADPGGTVAQICAFVGEAYEPTMLNFHQETTRNMPDVIRTPSVLQPVSRDNIEKWRRELKDDDVAVVEHVCADAMRQFGYDSSGARLSVRSRVATEMRLAYWAWQRARRPRQRRVELSYTPLQRTITRFGQQKD